MGRQFHKYFWPHGNKGDVGESAAFALSQVNLAARACFLDHGTGRYERALFCLRHPSELSDANKGMASRIASGSGNVTEAARKENRQGTMCRE